MFVLVKRRRVHEFRNDTAGDFCQKHADLRTRLAKSERELWPEYQPITHKSVQIRRELAEVEESMEKNNSIDPEAPLRALAVFDFSQNLVDVWRGSNTAQKREVLEVVSLNRHVNDVTLVLEKRKPFGYLAERPFLKIDRGGRI